MEEFLKQLTHDNNLFDEQWPDIYDKIRSIFFLSNGEPILRAFVDYILADPIDPPASDIKYYLIDLFIDELNCNEISQNTSDLINAFIRVLQLSSIDPWRLHFLARIYQKFQLGKRIFLDASRDDYLKNIFQNLQTKSFETHEEKWRTFLTQNLFSRFNDESNVLNQANMESQFEKLYQHATAHAAQSSLWSEIATILQETLFSNVVSSIDPMIEIEKCILENRFDDANSILSNIDFISIDLKVFIHSLIRYCSMVEDRKSFCSKFLRDCISKLIDLSVEKQHASLYLELALATLKLFTTNAPDLCYYLVRKENFYSWKDLIDSLAEIFQTCISYDTIENEKYFSDLDQLENILDIIAKRAHNYPQLMARIQPLALDTIFRWADVQFNGGNHVYRMGCVLFQCIKPEQITEDICGKFIDVLQGHVNSDMKETRLKTRFFLNDITRLVANTIQDLKRLSHSIHLKLSKLGLSILDQPLFDEEQNLTFEHSLLGAILLRTAQTIFKENDAHLYEKFLDRLYEKAKEQNNNILYQWWCGFWVTLEHKLPNLTRDHCEQFLEYTLTTKEMSLVGVSTTSCLQQPTVVRRYFNELMEMLLFNDGVYLSSLIYLFVSITQQYPEMITVEHIQQIFSFIESIPFNSYVELILHGLGAVANYEPQLFDNYQEKLIQLTIEQQNLAVFDCLRKYLIASMIIRRSENQAREYLKILIDLIQHPNCSNQLRSMITRTCLLIGFKYKQVLVDRRDDFVKFNSDLVTQYIDQMALDKNEGLAFKHLQEEIESIECKIKIQEVFLPSWTQNVTKLLNIRSDDDWRSLGKQLGFSTSEIKHWAKQSNPCLALFKEWFRIYQTDQAIAGLLKALVEIKRQDAEQIIRQASPSTNSVLPLDLKRIPPILLSFHSSERNFIVQLKDYLNKAGYSSQIDDEQTDLLTVETHIVGTKVIISTINRSYSQSENCVKHYNLNLKMKKPFIFLHNEEQIWPPDGPLKSIFQESLYIPFVYDKKNSEWPEKKFLELLAQIRYYVAPDSDLINGHYRQWFVPRLDTLIFLQSSTTEKNDFSTLFIDIPLVVSHPQIILSYQWDYQKDALNLYRQLTQFGYRVWLDIFQMTGNDPLLDKLHQSIRHSSCLLACITPKYIKSAHYREEFLVAKNFNKPIMCLLLEETNPWPPNDVELPLFAGKSYIDFRDISSHDRWAGKSLAMLLAQLKKVIPDIQTDKPRHLLDMQRPNSARPKDTDLDQPLKRRSSTPIIPQSRACSLM